MAPASAISAKVRTPAPPSCALGALALQADQHAQAQRDRETQGERLIHEARLPSALIRHDLAHSNAMLSGRFSLHLR